MKGTDELGAFAPKQIDIVFEKSTKTEHSIETHLLCVDAEWIQRLCICHLSSSFASLHPRNGET